MTELDSLLQHYNQAKSLKAWLNYSTEDIEATAKKYNIIKMCLVALGIASTSFITLVAITNPDFQIGTWPILDPDFLLIGAMAALLCAAVGSVKVSIVLLECKPITDSSLCAAFLELKENNPIVQQYVQQVVQKRQLYVQDYYNCEALYLLQQSQEKPKNDKEMCKKLHNIT